jgi:hypothetical protein
MLQRVAGCSFLKESRDARMRRRRRGGEDERAVIAAADEPVTRRFSWSRTLLRE